MKSKGSVSAKLLQPCYIVCSIDSSSRFSAEAEVGGHEGEGQALWFSVIEQYILTLWFSPFAYLNEDCSLMRTILVLYRKWKLEGMKVTGHNKAVFLQYDFSIDNEMQPVWNLTYAWVKVQSNVLAHLICRLTESKSQSWFRSLKSREPNGFTS